MSIRLLRDRERLPVWFAVPVWLIAFLSPTAYFELLVLADRHIISTPPSVVVWAIFYLIFVIALLLCGAVSWHSSKKSSIRVGWFLR
jgi:hypothetical protein